MDVWDLFALLSIAGAGDRGFLILDFRITEVSPPLGVEADFTDFLGVDFLGVDFLGVDFLGVDGFERPRASDIIVPDFGFLFKTGGPFLDWPFLELPPGSSINAIDSPPVVTNGFALPYMTLFVSSLASEASECSASCSVSS